MLKWLAILDTWLIMALTSFFTAAGLLCAHGLLRGQSTGSWENVILCLIEGGLGFCLVALFAERQGKHTQTVLSILQIIVILVLAWIFWFQPTPWLGLNDSVRIRHSLEREFLLQRLGQIGQFLLIVVPILGLGLAHRRMLQTVDPTTPPYKHQTIPLAAVVVLVLCLALIMRFVGTSTTGLAIQGVLLTGAIIVMLFELARRAVRAEKGILTALAVTAVGIPLISFWR
jgi:hypothetical protein